MTVIIKKWWRNSEEKEGTMPIYFAAYISQRVEVRSSSSTTLPLSSTVILKFTTFPQLIGPLSPLTFKRIDFKVWRVILFRGWKKLDLYWPKAIKKSVFLWGAFVTTPRPSLFFTSNMITFPIVDFAYCGLGLAMMSMGLFVDTWDLRFLCLLTNFGIIAFDLASCS